MPPLRVSFIHSDLLQCELTWLTQCASSITNRANRFLSTKRLMIPLMVPPILIISGVT